MTAPAGWYPDPENTERPTYWGQDRVRYWDGGRWTEQYAVKPRHPVTFDPFKFAVVFLLVLVACALLGVFAT